MTAFLKIDCCRKCECQSPWEWVPPVHLGGKTLAGTAVWRSQLTDGLCPYCRDEAEAQRLRHVRDAQLHSHLVRRFGGERPVREFTLEKFRPEAGTGLAWTCATTFRPAEDNLYLWGPCGIGKTHLAYAVAASAARNNHSFEVFQPPRLMRLLRMKTPVEEEAIIDRLVRAEVLILDDLGMSKDSIYTKQTLQEILDGRCFRNRQGLLVTSKYSLADLAARMDDDTIPSRLAGMCKVVPMTGIDHRVPGI